MTFRGCGISNDTQEVICYPDLDEPPFYFKTIRDAKPLDSPTSLLAFGDHGTVQGIGFFVSKKMIDDFEKLGYPTAGLCHADDFEYHVDHSCYCLQVM